MKLNELIATIDKDNVFQDVSKQESLCTLLRNHVNLETVNEWLTELSNQPEEQASKLASLMEIHPLGFEKYVIWDSEETGIRGRLHFWPQKKWAFESIHDHRFHFSAIVLCGHYIHEEYEVKELDATRVQLQLNRQVKVNAGDSYFFEAGRFHRVLPSEETTLSLIVRSKAILPYSRVINPEDMTMRKAYGNVNKFQSKLKRLSEIISDNEQINGGKTLHAY